MFNLNEKLNQNACLNVKCHNNMNFFKCGQTIMLLKTAISRQINAYLLLKYIKINEKIKEVNVKCGQTIVYDCIRK